MDSDTKSRLLNTVDETIRNVELKRAAAGPIAPVSSGSHAFNSEDDNTGSGNASARQSARTNLAAKATKTNRKAPVITQMSQQEIDSLTKNVVGSYSSYEIERIIQLQRFYDSYSYEPKVSDGGRIPDDGTDPLYQVQSNMTTIARILSAQLEDDKYWEDIKKESKDEEERARQAFFSSAGSSSPGGGLLQGSSMSAGGGYLYPPEAEDADEFIDDEELFSEGMAGGARLRARVAKLRDQLYNSSLLAGEKDVMFQIFRFARTFQTPNLNKTPLKAFLNILEPHTKVYEKEDPNPYLEAYGRPALQVRLLTALLRFRRDETNALKRVVKALMDKLFTTEAELVEIAEQAAREGASEINRLKAKLALMEREQRFLYYRVYGEDSVEYFTQQLADGTFGQTAQNNANAAAAAAATLAASPGSPASPAVGLSGDGSGASPVTFASTSGLSGMLAASKSGGLKAALADTANTKTMTKEQAAIHRQNKYRKDIDDCYNAMRDADVSKAVARVKGAKGQGEFYIKKLEAHLDQQREMTTDATLFALKAADSRARAVQKLRLMEQRMMELHDTMPLGRVAPLKQSLIRAERDAQKLFVDIAPGKFDSHNNMRDLPGLSNGSFAGNPSIKMLLSPKASKAKDRSKSVVEDIPTIPILNHIGRNNVRIVDLSEAIVKDAVPYLESSVKEIIAKIEANSKGELFGAAAASAAEAEHGSSRNTGMAKRRNMSLSGPSLALTVDEDAAARTYIPNTSYKHDKTVALLRHVTGAADVVRSSLCMVTTMVLNAAAISGSWGGVKMSGTGFYGQEGGPPTALPPQTTIRALAEVEAGGKLTDALVSVVSADEANEGGLTPASPTVVSPTTERNMSVSAFSNRRALVESVHRSTSFAGAAQALRGVKANRKSVANNKELKDALDRYDPSDPLSLPPKNPSIGPTDLMGDNVYFVGAVAQHLHNDGFLQKFIDKMLVQYMRTAEEDTFKDPYGLLTTGYRLQDEGRSRTKSVKAVEPADAVSVSNSRRMSLSIRKNSNNRSPATDGLESSSNTNCQRPRVETADKGIQAVILTTAELNAELNHAISFEASGSNQPYDYEHDEHNDDGFDAKDQHSDRSRPTTKGTASARGDSRIGSAGTAVAANDVPVFRIQSDDSSDEDDGEGGVRRNEALDDAFDGPLSTSNTGTTSNEAAEKRASVATNSSVGKTQSRHQSVAESTGGDTQVKNRPSTLNKAELVHEFESAHSDNDSPTESDNDDDRNKHSVSYNSPASRSPGKSSSTLPPSNRLPQDKFLSRGKDSNAAAGRQTTTTVAGGKKGDNDGDKRTTSPSSSHRPPKHGGGKAQTPSDKNAGGASRTSRTPPTSPTSASLNTAGGRSKSPNRTSPAGRPRDPVTGAIVQPSVRVQVGQLVSVGMNTKQTRTRNAYCQVTMVAAGVLASDELLGFNTAKAPSASRATEDSTARRLQALSTDIDNALLVIARHQASYRADPSSVSTPPPQPAQTLAAGGLVSKRRASLNPSSMQSPSSVQMGSISQMPSPQPAILLPSSTGNMVNGQISAAPSVPPQLCPVAFAPNPYAANLSNDSNSSLTLMIKIHDFSLLLSSCPSELVAATEMLRLLINDEVSALNSKLPNGAILNVVRCESDCFTLGLSGSQTSGTTSANATVLMAHLTTLAMRIERKATELPYADLLLVHPSASTATIAEASPLDAQTLNLLTTRRVSAETKWGGRLDILSAEEAKDTLNEDIAIPQPHAVASTHFVCRGPRLLFGLAGGAPCTTELRLVDALTAYLADPMDSACQPNSAQQEPSSLVVSGAANAQQHFSSVLLEESAAKLLSEENDKNSEAILRTEIGSHVGLKCYNGSPSGATTHYYLDTPAAQLRDQFFAIHQLKGEGYSFTTVAANLQSGSDMTARKKPEGGDGAEAATTGNTSELLPSPFTDPALRELLLNSGPSTMFGAQSPAQLASTFNNLKLQQDAIQSASQILCQKQFAFVAIEIRSVRHYLSFAQFQERRRTMGTRDRIKDSLKDVKKSGGGGGVLETKNPLSGSALQRPISADSFGNSSVNTAPDQAPTPIIQTDEEAYNELLLEANLSRTRLVALIDQTAAAMASSSPNGCFRCINWSATHRRVARYLDANQSTVPMSEALSTAIAQQQQQQSEASQQASNLAGSLNSSMRLGTPNAAIRPGTGNSAMGTSAASAATPQPGRLGAPPMPPKLNVPTSKPNNLKPQVGGSARGDKSRVNTKPYKHEPPTVLVYACADADSAVSFAAAAQLSALHCELSPALTSYFPNLGSQYDKGAHAGLSNSRNSAGMEAFESGDGGDESANGKETGALLWRGFGVRATVGMATPTFAVVHDDLAGDGLVLPHRFLDGVDDDVYDTSGHISPYLSPRNAAEDHSLEDPILMRDANASSTSATPRAKPPPPPKSLTEMYEEQLQSIASTYTSPMPTVELFGEEVAMAVSGLSSARFGETLITNAAKMCATATKKKNKDEEVQVPFVNSCILIPLPTSQISSKQPQQGRSKALASYDYRLDASNNLFICHPRTIQGRYNFLIRMAQSQVSSQRQLATANAMPVLGLPALIRSWDRTVPVADRPEEYDAQVIEDSEELSYEKNAEDVAPRNGLFIATADLSLVASVRNPHAIAEALSRSEVAAAALLHKDFQYLLGISEIPIDAGKLELSSSHDDGRKSSARGLLIGSDVGSSDDETPASGVPAALPPAVQLSTVVSPPKVGPLLECLKADPASRMTSSLAPSVSNASLAITRKYHSTLIPSLKNLLRHNSMSDFVHRQSALSPVITCNLKANAAITSLTSESSSGRRPSDEVNAAIAVIELHHWSRVIKTLIEPFLPRRSATTASDPTARPASSSDGRSQLGNSVGSVNLNAQPPLTKFQQRQNEERLSSLVCAASAITSALRQLVQRHLDVFEGVEVSCSAHFPSTASLSPAGCGSSPQGRGVALFPYWSEAHVDHPGTSLAHITIAFPDPIKATLCIAHLQLALEQLAPRAAAATAGPKSHQKQGKGSGVFTASGPKMSDGATEEEHTMRAIHTIMQAHNVSLGSPSGSGQKGLKVRAALHYGQLRCRDAFAISQRATAQKKLLEQPFSPSATATALITAAAGTNNRTASGALKQQIAAQQEAEKAIEAAGKALFGHGYKQAVSSAEGAQEAMLFYGAGLSEVFETLLTGPPTSSISKSQVAAGDAIGQPLNVMFLGGESMATFAFMRACEAHPAMYVAKPQQQLQLLQPDPFSNNNPMLLKSAGPTTPRGSMSRRSSGASDVSSLTVKTDTHKRPTSAAVATPVPVANTFSVSVANELRQRLCKAVTAYVSIGGNSDIERRPFAKVPLLPPVPTTEAADKNTPMPSNHPLSSLFQQQSHQQGGSGALGSNSLVLYIVPTSLAGRVKELSALSNELKLCATRQQGSLGQPPQSDKLSSLYELESFAALTREQRLEAFFNQSTSEKMSTLIRNEDMKVDSFLAAYPTSSSLASSIAIVASTLAVPQLRYSTRHRLYRQWLETIDYDPEELAEANAEAAALRGLQFEGQEGALLDNGGMNFAGYSKKNREQMLVASPATPSLYAGSNLQLPIPHRLLGGGGLVKSADTVFSLQHQQRFGGRNPQRRRQLLQQLGLGSGAGSDYDSAGVPTSPGARSNLTPFASPLSQYLGGTGGRPFIPKGPIRKGGPFDVAQGVGSKVVGGAVGISSGALGNSSRGVGASDLILAAALQQLFRQTCAVSVKAAKVMGYPVLSLAGNPNIYDVKLRDAMSVAKLGGASTSAIDLNGFHTSAIDVVEHSKTVVAAAMTALQCRTDKHSCFHRDTQTLISLGPNDGGADGEAQVYRRVKDTTEGGGVVFVTNATDNSSQQRNGTGYGRRSRISVHNGGTGNNSYYSSAGEDDGFPSGDEEYYPDGTAKRQTGAESMAMAMQRGYRPGGDQDITALRLRERRVMELEELLLNARSGGHNHSQLAPITISLGGALNKGSSDGQQANSDLSAITDPQEAATVLSKNYFGALTVFNRPSSDGTSSYSLLPPIAEVSNNSRKQPHQGQLVRSPTPASAAMGTGLPPIFNQQLVVRSRGTGGPVGGQLLMPAMMQSPSSFSGHPMTDFTEDAGFVTISRIDQAKDFRGDLAAPFRNIHTSSSSPTFNTTLNTSPSPHTNTMKRSQQLLMLQRQGKGDNSLRGALESAPTLTHQKPPQAPSHHQYGDKEDNSTQQHDPSRASRPTQQPKYGNSPTSDAKGLQSVLKVGSTSVVAGGGAKGGAVKVHKEYDAAEDPSVE